MCGGPATDPLPEARPFEAHLRPDDAFLDVFVGITNEGGQNVAMSNDAGPLQRFTRITEALDDFNAGGATQGGHAPVPEGPLYGGPEWRELFKHALREGTRLGLEMSLSPQSGFWAG